MNRTERRALTIWHTPNKHVGSKWCPKARSVHENSNFLLTHSQSTNTSPTRGLMLSDKTTLSGSNAQSKYSNHWDMNHNQPFWVAKNHEVFNIKVDRRATAPHNAGYCHWLTQRPGLYVSSMSGARNVLCLEIMPSELGFSLQFFLINQHVCCCDTVRQHSVTGIHKESLDPFLTNDIISDPIRDWTLTFHFKNIF